MKKKEYKRYFLIMCCLLILILGIKNLILGQLIRGTINLLIASFFLIIYSE